MTNQEIEKKLQSGFEKITPDVLASVLKDCKEQTVQGGQGMPVGPDAQVRRDAQGAQVLTIDRKKKRNPALRFAGIAAALLLLVGGFLGFRTWQINTRVASVISLDVNPSIEIRTNQKEKVLEVIPLNEDGRIIAGSMDFAGSSLEVTVNALVGSMLRNGYLSELANSILISIENDDPAAASALEQKLMAQVRDLLGDAHLEGAVLGQVVDHDKDAEAMAKDYGISVGKARLIEVMIADNPRYTAEELSKLSINELNNLYAGHHTPVEDQEKTESIDSMGKASTLAYIGKDAAIAIALQDAGIDAETVEPACELELDDGRMVYEIEFETDEFEYEYDIDARTGEIVSVEKEQDD